MRRNLRATEAIRLVRLASFISLLAGCFLWPVSCFYDDLLTPKRLVTLSVLALTAALECGLVLSRRWRPWDMRMAAVCCAIAALCESLYALVSSRVPLCGTFDNPAGLALSLLVLMPLSASLKDSGNRACGILAVASVLLSSIAVALCHSRTGALCLAVFFALCFVGRAHVRKSVALAAWLLIIIAVTPLALSVKEDSTSGRLFILGTTMRMIRQRPLTEYGHGGFRRLYMDFQASRFAAEGETCREAMLADDVAHPLNEFLAAWVDYGIAGPLVLAALLGLPVLAYVRKRNSVSRVLLLASLPVAVFSLSSYPLRYPVSWAVLTAACANAATLAPWRRLIAPAVLTLCVAAAVCLCREWRTSLEWGRLSQASQRGWSEKLVSRYRSLHREKGKDISFLYDYAYLLYSSGKLDSAYVVSQECRNRLSSYNLELLMGDILREADDRNGAIRHYRQAHLMCPVRFAPYEGMLKIYSASDTTQEQADSISRLILSKPVKVWSDDIRRIRRMAAEIKEKAE